jgi:hypothetical protein
VTLGLGTDPGLPGPKLEATPLGLPRERLEAAFRLAADMARSRRLVGGDTRLPRQRLKAGSLPAGSEQWVARQPGMAGSLVADTEEDIACPRQPGMAGSLVADTEEDIACPRQPGMAGALVADTEDDSPRKPRPRQAGMAGSLIADTEEEMALAARSE